MGLPHSQTSAIFPPELQSHSPETSLILPNASAYGRDPDDETVPVKDPASGISPQAKTQSQTLTWILTNGASMILGYNV